MSLLQLTDAGIQDKQWRYVCHTPFPSSSSYSLTRIFFCFYSAWATWLLLPQHRDSQKIWYCRIIPTPRGLSPSIMQHCQPMAIDLFMVWFIGFSPPPLLLFLQLTNLLSFWQMAWQGPARQWADIQVWNVRLETVYLHGSSLLTHGAVISLIWEDLITQPYSRAEIDYDTNRNTDICCYYTDMIMPNKNMTEQ